MFTLIFCTNRTDYINQQAIPRSRFAIALYQSNLRAIPTERFAIALGQFNLRAIALYQSKLQAIALYQSNLRAIALAQSNLRAIPRSRFAIALIAVMLTVKRLQNIYFPVFQL
jgi:hypothetical protein